MELFKIGFITIRLVDLIDISVVTFLFYKAYELLRGSLALRIILAILFVFVGWKLVDLFDMVLLRSILDEFLGVGALALIIIFSAEIRRFLLILGKNTLISRALNQLFVSSKEAEFGYNELVDAVEQMQKSELGALIILTGNDHMESIRETGDPIGAPVSERVLYSFFLKDSPLHDGAVIIDNYEIAAARCVLPLSKAPNLPPELGLRHRSALGVSEQHDCLVIVVSEERQEVSIVKNGEMTRNVDVISLESAVRNHYTTNKNET